MNKILEVNVLLNNKYNKKKWRSKKMKNVLICSLVVGLGAFSYASAELPAPHTITL